MRVLIAEPSDMMRRFIRSVVDPLGAGVIEASDGRTAMAAAESAPADLAIIAWRLPGLDGHELAAGLRSLGLAKRILMLTSEQRPDRIARALAAGVDVHIRKPTTPDVLSQRIEELMYRGMAA